MRAARAWMDWNRFQLSELTAVSPRTILNFEKGHTEELMPANELAIITVFKRQGIMFLEDDQGIMTKKKVADPMPDGGELAPPLAAPVTGGGGAAQEPAPTKSQKKKFLGII